jgi:hypothetical protein
MMVEDQLVMEQQVLTSWGNRQGMKPACGTCGMKCSDEESLRNHTERLHTPTVCGICGKTFMSEKGRHCHEQTQHMDQNTPEAISRCLQRKKYAETRKRKRIANNIMFRQNAAAIRTKCNETNAKRLETANDGDHVGGGGSSVDSGHVGDVGNSLDMKEPKMEDGDDVGISVDSDHVGNSVDMEEPNMEDEDDLPKIKGAIDKVRGSKMLGGVRFLKIHWLGCGNQGDSWEPFDQLVKDVGRENVDELMVEYHNPDTVQMDAPKPPKRKAPTTA